MNKIKAVAFILLLLICSACSKDSVKYEGNSENWKVGVTLNNSKIAEGEVQIEYIGGKINEINYFEYSLEGLDLKVSVTKQGNIRMPLKFKDSINNQMGTNHINQLSMTIIWGENKEVLTLITD
ncbi:hypothetical protein [Paenibacillus apiarius]|uniref:Lipoprotein n=1 Tax=Paenibacillus apiarius TaxID=46240 RepID=A0ABT4DT72_9BACL|nr:hypothetical protein [Paenibacillus apiarius]MCY9515012.1 hypothetical protein [Paenibacillus apiarius]MCY9520562.1 hypothetical protein [Paenibacillus apiarius]MCY9552132.1 hypothetical protein [Paenibacillus apiarius]MCY9561082.1 hypothetical protein [Paenibacillus apiarius]MCY9686277.1 hypothetical protein [Paenibacillus apiarius]